MVSWAKFTAFKRVFNWQPFMNRVYTMVSTKVNFMGSRDEKRRFVKFSWTFAAYKNLNSIRFSHKTLIGCFHYKRVKQYTAINIAPALKNKTKQSKTN